MFLKSLYLVFLMLFPVAGYSQSSDVSELTDESEESELELFSCFDYNSYGQNSYYYCSQNSNCQWRNYRCEDRYAPRPTQCAYIRNYNRCVSTYSCSWDQYRGCVTSGGGGYYTLFECNANDRGYEEHRGGHFGQGSTQWEAQNAALRACQNSHGSCFVRSCRQIR